MRVPKIGWQWCPRDPAISLNGGTVNIHLLVPIEYQDTFTSMDIHLTLPEDVEYEIIREDDRERTTFDTDPRLWNRTAEDGGFEYEIRAACHGIPTDTPARLMIEEVHNGTCRTIDGLAGGIFAQRWIG